MKSHKFPVQVIFQGRRIVYKIQFNFLTRIISDPYTYYVHIKCKKNCNDRTGRLGIYDVMNKPLNYTQ